MRLDGRGTDGDDDDVSLREERRRGKSSGGEEMETRGFHRSEKEA